MTFNQRFLSQFVFRGQGNKDWKLIPSLQRLIKSCHSEKCDPRLPNIYESEMLREFKYKFPIYNSSLKIDHDDNVEWLAIMQHYGAPTRLLDFTQSLYVALFMALDGSYENDSAIWAINLTPLRSESFRIYREDNNVNSVPHSILYNFIRVRASKIIDKTPLLELKDEVLPLFPKYCNERMSIQQGLFLMSTNLQKDFEDLLFEFLKIKQNSIIVESEELIDLSYNEFAKNGLNNSVMFKIIIPRKLKWELSTALRQMNITTETLFPGLSGLAKSLGMLRMREPNIYTE